MTVFDSFDEFWKGKGVHSWGQNAAGDDIVPGWYFAIIILSFIGAFAGAIIIGSYVNGTRWINRKNARVEGQEFVRSRSQQLIYRILMPLLATLILFTGYVGSIDGTLNIYKNHVGDYINAQPGNGQNDWMAFIPFFRSQGSQLYQCNIASIFILPWLMYFNKTKAMAIVAPFTFIGAATTVFSQSNLADGKWFDGFEVHRKAMEHIMLMTVPLFVLVANRFQLSTKSLVGSLLYIAVFNIIVAFAVYFGWAKLFDDRSADFGKDTGAGEFFEAAQMVGIDSKNMCAHFWRNVIFILGPITFAMSALIWIIYNFVFYASLNKIDASKITRPRFRKMIVPMGKINFKNLSVSKSEIDLGVIVSSLFIFMQAIMLKVIEGPKQFVKQFKQVEKDAWNSWLNNSKFNIVFK